VRQGYTLEFNEKHVDITMYGQIVESQPVDYWTGKKVDGQFIVLKDFLTDLDALKDAETLTIHMNSVGGDAYSAIAIHNTLRTLPAEKTAIVEGVAMSGGSLIICACEHTQAFANSLILWHHAWSFVFGGYNAPGLHKLAEGLEAMDKSQAEIYMRKTGKTLEEVMEIMDDEKHLTGREAHDMGLIDELVDEAEEEELDIAVSADKRTLFVKGHQMRIAAFGELPEGIKVVEAAPAPGSEGGFDNIEPDASGKEGGSNPMTLEEFRKENPEAAAALLAEAQADANSAAVQAERQRISDIDAISGLFSDDVVNAAKYGENACTAQEMAYRAAVESAKLGKKFMSDVQKDYKDSGANDVGAAPSSEDEDKPMTNADKEAAGEAMANKLFGNNKEV
jgi:ATP-dependent protease ClpP protease subunit